MSTEGWDPFFAKIASYPHLTEEREAELADLMKAGGEVGNDAKIVLLESNLRVVVSVAKREAEDGQAFVDLIVPAGNCGLVRALQTFDGWGRQSFSTYVSGCVMTEIQRYKRDPERYTTWAREHGVMWGEDAEDGWQARPPEHSPDGRDLQGPRRSSHRRRTSTGGYGAHGHAERRPTHRVVAP